MRNTLLLIMFLCLGIPLSVIHAQSTPLNEDYFWDNLQKTANLLQQPASGNSLRIARAMWQNVESIQLKDGTVVTVDLDWLNTGLASSDPASLTSLREMIEALLDYHQAHPAASLRGSLAALADILKDPRFHYPPTPTPQAAPTQQSQPVQNSQPDQPEGQPFIPVQVAQWVLVTVGVLIVGVLLVNFIRQLRIQQVTLPEQSAEEDPKTSDDARERAAGSEATMDYRTAIRYLYLASLLLLDERGVIHYDRTLTNREHLGQVAHNIELSNALHPVVNTFDNVWYGFATVNETMYEQFRQDVDHLRSLAP